MTPEKRKNLLLWAGAAVLAGVVCYLLACYADYEPDVAAGSLTLNRYEWDSLRSLGRNVGNGADDDFPARKQFDSLPALLLALNANRIGSVFTFKSAAEYLVRRNPGLKMSVDDSLYYYFKMGVSPADRALRDRLDAGLRTLREEGVLKKLTHEWIEAPAAGKKEPASRMPATVENAVETLRFGVTGDCPPLDYTAPDGSPAGFNVALLEELARAMNVNVRIVPVALEARSAALASGRIDVIFWVGSFNDAYEETGKNGLLTTKKYFSDPGATVTKSSRKVKVIVRR